MLKTITRNNKLSQEAVAKLAGMSQTFLSNVEKGKSDPSLTTLKRLAGALGVNVSDLVEDEKAIRPRTQRRRSP